MNAPVHSGPAPRYQRYRAYVDYINDRCAQPGVRAALRSGVRRTPEQAPRMHAAVAVWVPERASPAEERAYYAVASLIAAQPRSARDQQRQAGNHAGAPPEDDPAQPRRPRSLGDALARLNARSHEAENPESSDGDTPATGAARRRGDDGTASAALSPMERRLHLLTRQGLDGLHRHLPAMIRQLRTRQVEVDWAQLLDDLAHWPLDRDKITKRWLQDYYRTTISAAGTSTAADKHDEHISGSDEE